jgi:hypothetical protein
MVTNIRKTYAFSTGIKGATSIQVAIVKYASSIQVALFMRIIRLVRTSELFDQGEIFYRLNKLKKRK